MEDEEWTPKGSSDRKGKRKPTNTREKSSSSSKASHSKFPTASSSRSNIPIPSQRRIRTGNERGEHRQTGQTYTGRGDGDRSIPSSPLLVHSRKRKHKLAPSHLSTETGKRPMGHNQHGPPIPSDRHSKARSMVPSSAQPGRTSKPKSTALSSSRRRSPINVLSKKPDNKNRGAALPNQAVDDSSDSCPIMFATKDRKRSILLEVSSSDDAGTSRKPSPLKDTRQTKRRLAVDSDDKSLSDSSENHRPTISKRRSHVGKSRPRSKRQDEDTLSSLRQNQQRKRAYAVPLTTTQSNRQENLSEHAASVSGKKSVRARPLKSSPGVDVSSKHSAAMPARPSLGLNHSKVSSSHKTSKHVLKAKSSNPTPNRKGTSELSTSRNWPIDPIASSSSGPRPYFRPPLQASTPLAEPKPRARARKLGAKAQRSHSGEAVTDGVLLPREHHSSKRKSLQKRSKEAGRDYGFECSDRDSDQRSNRHTREAEATVDRHARTKAMSVSRPTVAAPVQNRILKSDKDNTIKEGAGQRRQGVVRERNLSDHDFQPTLPLSSVHSNHLGHTSGRPVIKERRSKKSNHSKSSKTVSEHTTDSLKSAARGSYARRKAGEHVNQPATLEHDQTDNGTSELLRPNSHPSLSSRRKSSMMMDSLTHSIFSRSGRNNLHLSLVSLSDDIAEKKKAAFDAAIFGSKPEDNEEQDSEERENEGQDSEEWESDGRDSEERDSEELDRERCEGDGDSDGDILNEGESEKTDSSVSRDPAYSLSSNQKRQTKPSVQRSPPGRGLLKQTHSTMKTSTRKGISTADSPKASTSKASTSKASTSKVSTSKASTLKASTSKVSTLKASQLSVSVSKAPLREASASKLASQKAPASIISCRLSSPMEVGSRDTDQLPISTNHNSIRRAKTPAERSGQLQGPIPAPRHAQLRNIGQQKIAHPSETRQRLTLRRRPTPRTDRIQSVMATSSGTPQSNDLGGSDLGGDDLGGDNLGGGDLGGGDLGGGDIGGDLGGGDLDGGDLDGGDLDGGDLDGGDLDGGDGGKLLSGTNSVKPLNITNVIHIEGDTSRHGEEGLSVPGQPSEKLAQRSSHRAGKRRRSSESSIGDLALANRPPRTGAEAVEKGFRITLAKVCTRLPKKFPDYKDTIQLMYEEGDRCVNQLVESRRIDSLVTAEKPRPNPFNDHLRQIVTTVQSAVTSLEKEKVDLEAIQQRKLKDLDREIEALEKEGSPLLKPAEVDLGEYVQLAKEVDDGWKSVGNILNCAADQMAAYKDLGAAAMEVVERAEREIPTKDMMSAVTPRTVLRGLAGLDETRHYKF